MPEDEAFTIDKQCLLLGLSRSTYYYVPVPVSPETLAIMNAIDKIYTAHPVKGKRSISADLKNLGYDVGIDLARTLMRKMGLEAIYRKPNLSKPCPGHKIYPYLLRGVEITRINQVWSTDITYIPMETGFLYLTAVIDWYSRYILSWKLSNSLEGSFCQEVLKEALELGIPDIFNTDQGCQYTSTDFTSILLEKGILISMDGRGRALDNIFIERLWRTVKYEDIYLKSYVNGTELYRGMKEYFFYYNTGRLHSSLKYKTPHSAYVGV